MNTRVLIRWSVTIVIAVGALTAIGLMLNPVVHARVATVRDWPGSQPPCNNPASLQQCIDGLSSGDVIHIKAGVYTQSVTLNKPVSLVGDDAQTTILNAEPSRRVLTVADDTIDSSVIISGFTLAHGNPLGPSCLETCGGGILISGTARPGLYNLTLEQNTASQGGGLWVAAGPGTRLVNVDFINNLANGLSAYGGGAFVSNFVRIEGGRFISNTGNGETALGGGLCAMGTSIVDTLFQGNIAGGSSSSGGGLFLSSGPNDLSNVTLIGNQANHGGAIYGGGLLTLMDVTMLNNTALLEGGGVYGNSANLSVIRGNYEGNGAGLNGGAFYSSGPLTLMAAKVSHNMAANGGGVYAGSAVWITNTFLIQNSAQDGGGLYQTSTGDAHIVNTLFARNQSTLSQTAAIVFAATGSFSIVYSDIVDNVPNPANAVSIENGNAAADIRDSIISGHAVGIQLVSGVASEDYNLYFNNVANTFGPVTMGGHSIPNVDPQFVDPLKDDYHLHFTSPAINAGIDVGVNFDIDGQPRPIGPGFDIGFDETGSSIQELIDFTPPGGVVSIPTGLYVESLNLYKPVSLIGAGNTATIIQAKAGDRVLTVTGPITTATQIANLALTGGDVRGAGFNRAGGGVLITGTAYPSFYNVQIVGNNAELGGGLYVQSGGASLNNTVVANNYATQSGGGAYVVEPTAVLEQIGGAILNNTAIDGAGVFVQSGQFRQNSGVILNNTATHWGGGLLVGSGGTIQALSGQIISNSAQSAGGGVFVDVGSADLLDSQIMNNTAAEGGGVYVRDLNGTTASLIGGNVEGNIANGYGGGVYAGGTLYITGTRLFANSAYDGSALEITGTSRARVVNAFIADNVASGATNSSLRFDSSNSSAVLHTTLGNATQPLTRALVVNNGVVAVANTIVASYTNGLSQFGGQLLEGYNLFFGTPITASGSISHAGPSLVGLDPQFKDPPLGDYHIKGLSPAVNRGTDVGVRRDIDQDPRPLGGAFDIGADEASVASTIVGSNLGGSFTYTTMQNSTINVSVPTGAVTQTASIYCSLIDTANLQPPYGLKFVGTVFELDANLDPVNVTPGSISFNKPVTLSVSYTDQQLASAGITDEQQLKLYRYEPLLNDWRPVGFRPNETQTLDVNNNIITATVLGFSRFGSMGRIANLTKIFLPIIARN